MPRTAPRVSFGLFALALKQDASFSVADKQPFSKTNDLKTGNVTTSKPYITLEPDYWLLDGNYKFMPADDDVVHVGLWSLSQSDANGDFETPPTLTIVFGSTHSSDGLTIRFASTTNDFASDIDVAYYDESDALIRSDNYTPVAWEFQTNQEVEDFKKIVIVFNSTNKPHRFLRVMGIDFGKLIYFENDAIKVATVKQTIHPLSLELPIDTLKLELFSADEQFSIVDPTGNYAALKRNQPLDVYELVNGASLYIGQFYLSEWENLSETKIKFDAVDRLGVIDSQTYMGGIWTTPINAEDLIDDILTEANAPYELDSNLNGIQITGWIPVCTYREALQQIAFAIRAYVTCSRSGVLKIYRTTLASDVVSPEHTITKSQKSLDQSLKLKELVTGVEITSHNYVTNEDVRTLYNGVLAAGSHLIKFDAPKRNLSVSGATIQSSGANYAMLEVVSPGTVLLTGKGYDDTTQVYGVYNQDLDPNVPKKIISVKNATLINSGNVGDVTQHVYDYYQQRYLQKVKLFAPLVSPSEAVFVETFKGRQIKGVVEKMQIDLSKGMTAQTEITGVIV